jgi:hypothetical protein
MYKPNPIETGGVMLPEEVMELAEKLAKNTHEVWAASRIREGWTYGPERSDALRTTPCLVPYEELTETEKAYDRRTSLETLKLIRLLGFRIEREERETAP